MLKAACLLAFGLCTIISALDPSAHATPWQSLVSGSGLEDSPVKGRIYTVQKGDCLYAIGESMHMPRNKLGAWVARVVRHNPYIQNPDVLFPGDRLYLPPSLVPDTYTSSRPGDAMAKRPSTSIRTGDLPAGKKVPSVPNQPSSEPGLSNKDLVIHQLTHLGFGFSQQGELIYPLGHGQWVRIHLQQTPLASSPWGSSVLFAPRAKFNDSMIESMGRAGLTVCPVPLLWTPQEVYTALEDTCRSHFMVWSSPRPLIVGLPEKMSLEIKARTILAVQDRRKFRFAVFAQTKAGSHNVSIQPPCPKVRIPHNIPGLLLGYLQNNDIQLLWSASDASKPAWAQQTIPSEENLFLPSISWKDLITQRSGPQSAPSDPDLELETAQDFNHHNPLQSQDLCLSWSTGDGLSLILRGSILSRNQKGQIKYLLPFDRADPYLVALLNLMGYNTYELLY
ncbi:MAG: LysM peptidoglycan-binding domain-containing protein [Desulfovermiculus sp.]|nr:LysM peptidoglycan-binding domain-containing protein [Desulfovermiculus sp.]